MGTKTENQKAADRRAQELVDNLNRNVKLKHRADGIARGPTREPQFP